MTTNVASFQGPLSYGYNTQARYKAGGDPVSMANINRGAEVFILGDSQNVAVPSLGLTNPWSGSSPTLYPGPCGVYSSVNTFGLRHFDGGNVLFYDGHVKWYLNSKVNGNANDMWGCNTI